MRRASLNHAYRLVWSSLHAAFIPVPEWAAARGKGSHAGRVTMMVAAGLLMLGAGGARAATDTWSGGGGDANWSTAGNWVGGVAPVAADNLVFTGSTQPANTNDIASTTFGSLTFDSAASAFTLGGVATGVSAGITNSSSSLQTLSFAQLSATASQTWDAGTGGLAVTAPVVLSAGTALTVTGTADTTISGAISESAAAGSLVKSGTGTLTLTGDSTYTGGTTISAGTLQLGNGGGTGWVSGDITDNAALVFNHNTSNIFGGVISGTGSLTQTGGNILALTGTNTYTGGTTIGSGSGIYYGNGGTTGSIVGDVVDNGTLYFNRTDNTSFAGNISGTGGIYLFGGGAITLSGNNTYSGSTIIGAGSLVTSGGNAIGDSSAVSVLSGAGLTLGAAETIGSLSDAGTVDNGGFTLTTGGDNTSTTYSGVMSGAGGLTKTGTGTMTLSGANTYTGATTISAGTLQVTGGAAIADTSAVTVASGATLALGASETIGSLAGAGSVTLGANALTAGGDNSSTTFSGVISDTGSLVKDGTGTLTLLNFNTYTGGTTISAGTLQLGNGSGGGWVTGNIADNSALVFNHNVSNIFSGAISGTGTVTVTGASTLMLTNANTYTGGTTISAGATLAISNGGSISDTGVVTDNGTLTFTHSDAIAFGGKITGSGSVVQAGTGTLTLSGPNDYSGATTVSSGTLVANGGSAIGDQSAVTVASGATIAFGATEAIGSIAGAGSVNLGSSNLLAGYNNTSTTFSGVMSGTGSLTKTGGGTLTLSGANTYTGATTVNTGILQLNGGAAIADTSAVTVNGGASLVLGASETIGSLAGAGSVANGGFTLTSGGDNTSTTYSGVMSGTGGLTKIGTGILSLGGANTYTGATTVNAGTLQLNGGSAVADTSAVIVASGATLSLGANETIGSLSGAGNVTNGGFMLTSGGDSTSTTFSGVVSGTGGLTKTGSGTLTLTGANTYTGGTTISAGTLQVGNGGTTGAIAGDIVDNGALVFNRSNAVTYGGNVSGTGSLTQAGSGLLVLNGTNTYSGGTTVSAGTLEVGDITHAGASVAGNVLLSGGMLRGHGTIGGNVVNTAGTVFPGGSIGILTVAGNYTQGPAGTLAIEVTPNATPGVGYDQLQVTGSASLDGALQFTVDAGTYSVGTVYDIVHAAGGVTGTFATTSYNPAFAAYLTPAVTYAANDVYLTLNPTPQAFSSGDSVLQQLFTLNQMSRSALEMVQSDAPSIAFAKPLDGVWLQGFGGGGKTNGFNVSNGAALLGVGGKVQDELMLGVALSSADSRTNDGTTLVKGNSMAGYGYGLYTPGNWRLYAAVGMGQFDADSQRALTSLGVVATGSSSGSFDAATVGGRYHVALVGSFFEPYVGVSMLRSQLDGYQESGAGLLNIHYGNETQDLTTLDAGVRIGTEVPLGAVAVVPWARVGGTQYFGDRTVNNTESVGSVSQTQSLGTVTDTAVDVGAGVEVGGKGPWHGSLSWSGQHGQGLSLDNVKAEIEYQW